MKHVVKIAILLTLLITTAVATPTHWRTISAGVAYTRISFLSGFHTGYLHAFKIDLQKNQLKLAIAEDQRNKIATVTDLATTTDGIIATNGGFFSQELKPLGLRVSDFKQRTPLKPTPWWGVFYIKNNRPYITGFRGFRMSPDIQFAIQSGPRLVIDAKVPISLKPGVDSRTALGITSKGEVMLVVTDRLNLTTTQLAKLMRAPPIEGGLDCRYALNLDGGTSSQLYVKTDDFSLKVPGLSAVTDAIIVIPKEALTNKSGAYESGHSNNS